MVNELPAPTQVPATSTRRQVVTVAQVQAAPVPQAQTPPATEDKYKDKRLLVLFFDLEAMPAADRAKAFSAAQEFVRTKMQVHDLLAILTANADVKVVQDFTGDHDLLLRTLDWLTADSGTDSGGIADASRQLNELQTAVNMLGSITGRKALIYFSMPLEKSDSAQARDLISLAVRANVAFYTVDAEGLLPQPSKQPYTIGGQDVLQIWVAGQQGISGSYVVRPDGIISMPMVGEVRAAGLTVEQLQAVIADRLEANQILSNASVTVGVAKAHSRKQNQ
jgi:VWFA-related protein